MRAIEIRPISAVDSTLNPKPQPGLRGSAVGRQMIEARLRRRPRGDCAKVHWLTHETNATAIQLFERIAERPGFIQFRHARPEENPMSTPLARWQGAPAPSATRLEGRFIILEKLDPARHGDDLWQALTGPGADPRLWDYLPYGPFSERNAFDAWLDNHAAHSDPYFFSVLDKASGQVQGILSLMSIVPDQGRIEIGHLTFGAPMQRSPKSTEAVYLLARESFALGYRRLEWKCDNSNTRSCVAAERLGFSFEGVFRQHLVVKGRNRDTAWYSIIDGEWPKIAAGFQRWLSEENLSAEGQGRSLVECRG